MKNFASGFIDSNKKVASSKEKPKWQDTGAKNIFYLKQK